MAKTPNKSAKKTSAKKISAKKPSAKETAATKLEFVVEGDSWEHLPDFGLKSLPIVGGANYDLSRALADRGHVVHNIAYWGDTIAAIANAGDYLKVLRKTGARLLLLGGGGNDLLGDGRMKNYLRLYIAERPVKDYVLDVYYQTVRQVILDYERIMKSIVADKQLKTVKVIVHGYDYVEPMRLGWVGEPMDFVGIDHLKIDLQRAIVKVMLDAFNDELKAFAKRHPSVVYIDFRKRVNGRWHDELHPTREAFSELAGMIEAKAG
ncbi:MAG: hypothetical protein K2Z25_14440 [Beijerinckiaceae bacterium]|nr:hypothetical protein [Beijerinckiaceae bacterium]